MTDTPTLQTDSQLEADISEASAVPSRLMDAWAQHDAEAFAAIFDEDGTMILRGNFATGRTAIKEFMTRAFIGPFKDTRVIGTPFLVKRLGADTVLLLTEGGVLRAGCSVLEIADTVRASWLLTRTNGVWKLTAYQNTPAH